MTIEEMKRNINDVVQSYPIKSVVLFGSRADMTNREDDLIEVNKVVELYAA